MNLQISSEVGLIRANSTWIRARDYMPRERGRTAFDTPTLLPKLRFNADFTTILGLFPTTYYLLPTNHTYTLLPYYQTFFHSSKVHFFGGLPGG